MNKIGHWKRSQMIENPTERMKEFSVKNKIKSVKLDCPFTMGRHWTWELRVWEHSLGVMVSPSRSYKTGWPMLKRAWPRQGQISPNHKFQGGQPSATIVQSQWDLAVGEREENLVQWQAQQSWTNQFKSLSLSFLIWEIDCCVYFNSVLWASW